MVKCESKHSKDLQKFGNCLDKNTKSFSDIELEVKQNSKGRYLSNLTSNYCNGDLLKKDYYLLKKNCSDKYNDVFKLCDHYKSSENILDAINKCKSQSKSIEIGGLEDVDIAPVKKSPQPDMLPKISDCEVHDEILMTGGTNITLCTKCKPGFYYDFSQDENNCLPQKRSGESCKLNNESVDPGGLKQLLGDKATTNNECGKGLRCVQHSSDKVDGTCYSDKEITRLKNEGVLP